MLSRVADQAVQSREGQESAKLEDPYVGMLVEKAQNLIDVFGPFGDAGMNPPLHVGALGDGGVGQCGDGGEVEIGERVP